MTTTTTTMKLVHENILLVAKKKKKKNKGTSCAVSYVSWAIVCVHMYISDVSILITLFNHFYFSFILMDFHLKNYDKWKIESTFFSFAANNFFFFSLSYATSWCHPMQKKGMPWQLQESAIPTHSTYTTFTNTDTQTHINMYIHTHETQAGERESEIDFHFGCVVVGRSGVFAAWRFFFLLLFIRLL